MEWDAEGAYSEGIVEDENNYALAVVVSFMGIHKRKA